MRNLTIQRTKSFVGSLAKVKIYLEDHEHCELEINNLPCRKLGEIKNGETQTFVIGDGAAKVFAIVDKVSKNFCNDFYQLPYGQEDIFITGKNRFDPPSGNPFCFDGNPNGKEKSSGKRIAVYIGIVLLCVVLGYLVGYTLMTNRVPDPETFTESGLQITLTEKFTPVEFEGRTACFDSAKIAVFALKEEFTPGDEFSALTLQEYAELSTQVNGVDKSEIKKDGDLTWFSYDYTDESSNVLEYVSYVFKSEDGFWLIQFAGKKADVTESRDQISQWAQSIRFTGE